MVMQFHSESFRGITRHDCETQLRALNSYSAPMPWIGMYIAAASLICTILMFCDLVYAIRWRKFWFPSKYFTLNAATLTLLGVVVKLSLDISSPMPRVIDKSAKLCNNLFILTIMGYFSTSLGSMGGKSLKANMTALAILVVTIFGNLIIQMVTGLISYERSEEPFVIFCLFITLVTLVVIAFNVPTLKRNIEAEYRKKYQKVLNEERLREGRIISSKLELVIKKFWIMAVSSSPQFVFGLSGVCTFPLYLILLVNSYQVPWNVAAAEGNKFFPVLSAFPSSDYSWSVVWILAIQTIGCVIGTLSLTSLWVSEICMRGVGKTIDFKLINKEKPSSWSKRPLVFQIGGRKCRKLMYHIRTMSSFFFYWVLLIPLAFNSLNFILHILFASLIRKICCCYFYSVKLMEYYCCVHPTDNSSDQKDQEAEMDHLGDYVVLVHFKEVKMPRIAIKMICYELQHIIQTGRRRQPKDLFRLLQRSNSFSGLIDFDHIQVPSLHTEEPPSCWTLPVMTLAAIAIALPHEDNHSVDNIIQSVTEGLKYADIVDRSLEAKETLRNIRNAVKVVWLDVEMDKRWLNVKPVMRMSGEGKSSKEILQELAVTAAKILEKFKEGGGEGSQIDPIDWPNEVVAANSMYRITKTLLLKSRTPKRRLLVMTNCSRKLSTQLQIYYPLACQICHIL